MIIKTATCLALAAACLAITVPAGAQTGGETVVVTPPPRVDPGDLNWNPLANLKEAQQYDRLLKTNPAFRMARLRKECGPITDPQLHALRRELQSIRAHGCLGDGSSEGCVVG
jgi:hypothetical protein